MKETDPGAGGGGSIADVVALTERLRALPRYLLRQVARRDGQDWMATMLPESDVRLQRDDEDRWINARDLAAALNLCGPEAGT